MKRLLRAPAFWACFSVLAVVLAANAVYLIGLRSNSPMLYHSGLGSPTRGVIDGTYTIDPNDGWTVEALGRLAAESWLHGQVPLWNVYEGLGQPLAGEMQSAAFFLPFVLFNLLPNGSFFMHLALELVAGFGTVAFLRSLRLSWVAAAAGGCLFAVNGAFSVMTNAPFNPLAFLPTALWGVELIAAKVRARGRPRAGIWVTSLSVAFMLFSGFPETAYLEALFLIAWVLYRMVVMPDARWRFLLRVALGGLIGIVIAAPILAAFLHFLGFASTAYHAGGAIDYAYRLRQIPALALPYLAGGLGNQIFDVQAGYLTLPAVLLALIGFAGKRHRSLQVIFGVISVLLLLNMFGFVPVRSALRLIPGMSSVMLNKYGVAILEFVVVVFAAYGLDDLRRRRARRWVLASASCAVIGFFVAAVVYLQHGSYLTHLKWTIAVAGWTLGACAIIALCIVLSRRTRGLTRRGDLILAVIAAAVITVDATGTYAVPQLSASAPHPVNLGSVRYLKAHLGTSRFYTLGPIQPNYGSYWGIAQLNANDLPVPQKYDDLVTKKLRPAPGTPASVGTEKSFIGYVLSGYNTPPDDERLLLEAYGQRQRSFREASAKYIVMQPGVGDEGRAAQYGLEKVYSDRQVDIWKDPKAEPMYSTADGNCTITAQQSTSVTVNCSAASTLTRRGLSAPGWTAAVNGAPTDLGETDDGLYQTVKVSRGTSHVELNYQPRFFTLACVLSLGTLLLMLLDAVWMLVRRRRTTAPTRHETALTDDVPATVSQR